MSRTSIVSGVPFNRVYLTGQESVYLQQALDSGHLCGNGPFSQKCCEYFSKALGSAKTLLTSSCTDALEMAALLCDIQPGDEVILPSYTFVSTANAFALRGAELKFADSQAHHPNISVQEVERLLSPKTKAIVVVHYGGVACEMDEICALAKSVGARVIEDAAHSIHAHYKGRPLGSIGDLSTFSFHQTKNIISGEGGLLAVNDPSLSERAEILWEKGTDRSKFFRGEVDKYGWVDLGSSFLASELIAAVLWAQLESVEAIQRLRVEIWDTYSRELTDWARAQGIFLPPVPDFAENNAHLFALICKDAEQREKLTAHLKKHGISAHSHYLPLHQSQYFQPRYQGPDLPYSVKCSDCLLRLPLYAGMLEEELSSTVKRILEFS